MALKDLKKMLAVLLVGTMVVQPLLPSAEEPTTEPSKQQSVNLVEFDRSEADKVAVLYDDTEALVKVESGLVRNQGNGIPVKWVEDGKAIGTLWKTVGDADDNGYHTVKIGVKGETDPTDIDKPMDLMIVLDNSNSMYDAKNEDRKRYMPMVDKSGKAAQRMTVLKQLLLDDGGFFDQLSDGNKDIKVGVVPFSTRLQDGKTYTVKNYLYPFIKQNPGYIPYYDYNGKKFTANDIPKYVDIPFPNGMMGLQPVAKFTGEGTGKKAFLEYAKMDKPGYYNIANPAYFGATYLDAGLKSAKETLDKSDRDRKKVVLVISDGAPTIASKIKNYANKEFEDTFTNEITGEKQIAIGGGDWFSGFDDPKNIDKWWGFNYTTEDGKEITNMGEASKLRAELLRDAGYEVYAMGIALTGDKAAHVTKEETVEVLKGVTGTDIYSEEHLDGKLFLSENLNELEDHLAKIVRKVSSKKTIDGEIFLDPIGASVEVKNIDAEGKDAFKVSASSETLKKTIEQNLTYDVTTRTIKVTPLSLGEDDWFEISYEVRAIADANSEGKWLDTNGKAVIKKNEGDEGKEFPKPAIRVFKPKAEPAATEDFQGVVQEATIVLSQQRPAVKDPEIVNFFGNTDVAGGVIDPSSLTLLKEEGGKMVPTNEVVVDGQGTYRLDQENLTITFTPLPNFGANAVNGTKVSATPVVVQAANANGQVVETTYTPTVVSVNPLPNPAETIGYQGEEQEAPIAINAVDGAKIINFNAGEPIPQAQIDPESITLMDGDTPVNVVRTDAGEFELVENKTKVIFRPNPSFGAGAPEGNPAVAPSVTIRATDKNGTTVTTTYTPKVIGVIPKGLNSETSDFQGVPQTSSVVINQKDTSKKTLNFIPGTTDDGPGAPIKEDSLTLLDAAGNPTDQPVDAMKDGVKVGSYSFDKATNVITFTPEPNFVGEAPAVTVQARDENDTAVTATYTPTVIGVIPTATPSKTKNYQGVKQESPIVFNGEDVAKNTVNFIRGKDIPQGQINEDSITLLDENGDPTDQPVEVSIEIDGVQKKIGTYTLNKAEKKIEFQPEGWFTGTAPAVGIQASDENGTTVKTTYTPTVIGVTPLAHASTTMDVKGETQVSPVVFGADKEDDTVNFCPGIGPKTPIEINPDSVKLLNEDGDEVDSVRVDGQGTYTLVKNGDKTSIEFTPDPNFVGVATPVRVQASDENGTKVETKYTPTVIEPLPTGKSSKTTDKQGELQTSPIAFTSDDEANTLNLLAGSENTPINKDSIHLVGEDGRTTDTITIDGVGTYALVKKDGNVSVTFQPVNSFVGKAPAVTVQAFDTRKNGIKPRKVEVTYTPTVTPITPTASASETVNYKNVPQSSEIVFGQTDNDSTTVNLIPGETNVPIDPESVRLVFTSENGTETEYTVDQKIPVNKDGEKIGEYVLKKENGKTVIVFTPATDFVGEVPEVMIRAEDKYGTPVTTSYTPKVIAVTTEPAVSLGIKDAVQTAKIGFNASPTADVVNFVPESVGAEFDIESVSLLDEKGNRTNEVIVKGEGTYELKTDEEDGSKFIKFTPDKTFVGKTTGVKIAANVAGNDALPPITTTYTPTVVGAKESSTSDFQGKKQTSPVVFGNDKDELKDTVDFVNAGLKVKADSVKLVGANGALVNEVEAKDVKGNTIGTYRLQLLSSGLSPRYAIEFEPIPTYTGKVPAVPVTIRAIVEYEENHLHLERTLETTYTPHVESVEPEATPSITSGKQGAMQKTRVYLTNDTNVHSVNFKAGNTNVALNPKTLRLLDAKGNKTEGAVVVFDAKGAKVGTYNLVWEEGIPYITFQPEPNFVGTAPAVWISCEDINGTEVRTTYTPTVVGNVKKVVNNASSGQVSVNTLARTSDDLHVKLYVTLLCISIAVIGFVGYKVFKNRK